MPATRSANSRSRPATSATRRSASKAWCTSNEDEISATASNLAVSAARLNAILEDVQKGQGTAGKLLTDPTLRDEIVKLVQNWRRFGILYKDKTARPVAEEPKAGKSLVPARPASQ